MKKLAGIAAKLVVILSLMRLIAGCGGWFDRREFIHGPSDDKPGQSRLYEFGELAVAAHFDREKVDV